MRAADIADMVGADDGVGGSAAVVVGRAHADGDARQARHRLDAPNDLRRTESALEPVEARREIGDATACAVDVGQDRLDDRGVAQIARLGFAPGRRERRRKSPSPRRPRAGARTPDRSRNSGKHHQTMRACWSTNAAAQLLPMRARSSGCDARARAALTLLLRVAPIARAIREPPEDRRTRPSHARARRRR